MLRRIILLSITSLFFMQQAGQAADPMLLEDENLQESMRSLTTEAGAGERLKRAQDLVRKHRLSSLQVKAIAARLPDDTTRYEFALAAYPRTVDPENFYEVYDAFTSLSKVMRLHDQVRPQRRLHPEPVVVVPPPVVSDEALEAMVQSLRKESFSNTRMQIAKQILKSSEKPFLSNQIQRLVRCFEFENSRLELAKFAYDYVLDREMYFVVNDAMEFTGSREALSQYIQKRPQPRAPHGRTPSADTLKDQ